MALPLFLILVVLVKNNMDKENKIQELEANIRLIKESQKQQEINQQKNNYVFYG